MTEYKTPGVYVKEISKFPPSVAGVATAIPAFIGFTEKTDYQLTAMRINSLLDYEKLFGVGPELELDKDGNLLKHKFVLYDSIRLFYDNGGGTCYVVSLGGYETDAFNAGQYTKGLEPLKKVDEVTLLVAPDAAMLLNDEKQLGDVHKAMLSQCVELGDRFAILDPKENDDLNTALNNFRENVGSVGLSYGAAYYPYLKTTYTKDISFDEMLKNKDIGPKAKAFSHFKDYDKTAVDTVKEELPSDAELDKFKETEITDANSKPEDVFEEYLGKKFQLLYNDSSIEKDTFENNDCGQKMLNRIIEAKNRKPLMAKAFAAQIDGYAEKLAELQDEASIIPPSGAIAGIFAATDSNKGVWQAPANISIAAVADVTELISDKDQENMNVDATSGKSVNAIRFFTGKGILVWGARTLDGNSNEWRYVPIRRLFNYVEESVQKSTNWAVFQPNDANTWVKIQCQIENFLNNLWRDGALAGSTPDKAFYVKVGLDVTMTADDINNGYLIVEIGLAAVRPAEFIVLKFSHKVQEA